MIGWFVLALYAINIVVAMRIVLTCLTYGSESIEAEDWFIVILAGLFWPLTLVCGVLYLIFRLLVRPIVIPPHIRRAEREWKLRERAEARRDAQFEARRRAREHGLTIPGG